jgi:hypothetical protein
MLRRLVKSSFWHRPSDGTQQPRLSTGATEADNLAQATLGYRDYTNSCSFRRVPSEILAFRRYVTVRISTGLPGISGSQHKGAGRDRLYEERKSLIVLKRWRSTAGERHLLLLSATIDFPTSKEASAPVDEGVPGRSDFRRYPRHTFLSSRRRPAALPRGVRFSFLPEYHEAPFVSLAYGVFVCLFELQTVAVYIRFGFV